LSNELLHLDIGYEIRKYKTEIIFSYIRTYFVA
jgi:hypothetical protein